MSRATPVSLPTSPKKNGCTQLPPVTPQRSDRGHKQFRSVSSPLTPVNSSIVSSPFTPLTNLYYSPSSSVTPSSVSSGTRVDSSPENIKTRKGVADTAGNWRLRAKENGIRVSANNMKDEDTMVGSKGAYIEGNVNVRTNRTLYFSSQLDSGDILPESFLSTHRRSRQAQFQTKSSDITALTSPKAARLHGLDTNVFTPSPRKTLSALNTPSPRTSSLIVEKLKLRGSLTDPARTRRRPAFGATAVRSDTLFDIDENVSENAPYFQDFGSPISLNRASRLRCVSDTYASILQPETDAVPFSSSRHNVQSQSPFSVTRPSKVNKGLSAMKSTQVAKVDDSKRRCSVCSSSSSPLSSLLPCEHLICSSCLTGALNIVGEKDMCCAACECLVEDFKLLLPLGLTTTETEDKENSAAASLLPSMFNEFRAGGRNSNKHEVLTPCPPESLLEISGPNVSNTMDNELAVLRIDNVPWDITPPALSVFFEPYPIIHAHVLLEPKGKTLSHAYVELSPSQAKKALRSVQNKTMGKGRRMRGVTVTMSSQAEVMRALFPNWKGTFDGSKPSLNGLDNDKIVKALEYGLISLNELDSLITLMRNPDSHFLKVPSLPFYSLASILAKFPADIDSRVFWSSTLRDLLHDITFAATQILLTRLNEPRHDQQLLEQIVQAGVNCQAFTDHQRLKLIELIDSTAPDHADQFHPRSATCDSNTTSSRSEDLRTPDDARSFASESERSFRYERKQAVIHPMPTAINFSVESPRSPYNALAREFGVEPDMIHALAQRLALAGPVGYPAFIGRPT